MARTATPLPNLEISNRNASQVHIVELDVIRE